MAALHTLVETGKVRYIGVSDTPAWKAAQAQVLSQFRGWPAFIATQIEYSLLERTVEGELVPMAQELGMGVIPWSPLGGGRLSGKYRRSDDGSDTSGRANTMRPRLTEKTFEIVDELERIADELDSTIPRVALAWVIGRPGVGVTIMGARTMAHLEDDVQALDLTLSPDHRERLDALTTPQLSFPIPFLARMAAKIQQGGTTVNGVAG